MGIGPRELVNKRRISFQHANTEKKKIDGHLATDRSTDLSAGDGKAEGVLAGGGELHSLHLRHVLVLGHGHLNLNRGRGSNGIGVAESSIAESMVAESSIAKTVIGVAKAAIG